MTFFYSFDNGETQTVTLEEADTDFIQEFFSASNIKEVNEVATELDYPKCKRIVILIEPC